MNRLEIQLNYGSIAGLVTFIIFLVLAYSGTNPFGGISWLNVLILIGLIVHCVKTLRDREAGGFISFRQGMGAGLLVSFVYASMFAMLVYLYGTFVEDEFFRIYITEVKAYMSMDEARAAWGDGLVADALERIEDITLGRMAMLDFQAKLLGGMALSMVIAGILRRVPQIGQEEHGAA